jgi:hypothetical protein
MLAFLLLAIAFLCFVLAAFGVSAGPVNLIALGLACWILIPLMAAWPG